MSTPAAAHRLFAARPRSGLVVDVVIAVVALLISLALLFRHTVGPLQSGPEDPDVLGALLAACSTLPLVAWRRRPLEVFVVTAAATTLLAVFGYSIGLAVGPTVALYLLAASRTAADPWSRETTTVVVGLFVAYLAAAAVGERTYPGTELLHTGFAWCVAWFAGERTRLLHEHVAELRDRAVRVDRDAERERRLAIAEERTRIARDLHDSAGHAINVIAVRAGAARLRHDEDPERSRAALEVIEDIARQTVAEIDQIVGTLRDDDAEQTSPPKLASLDTLIGHYSSTGLDVTVERTGASPRIAAGVELAAYRILQEALTNAARHGTGEARVVIDFRRADLAVTVTNPVPANSTVTRNGTGHGLIGMRERATLLGGQLEAGRAGNAFRVRALLPYEG